MRMKQWIALLLALCALLCLTACEVDGDDIAAAVRIASEVASVLEDDTPAEDAELPQETETPGKPDAVEAPEAPDAALDPDGWYTTKEDVALYLYTYGELPGNFITKSEARALGWEGGGLDGYADGKSIGGDSFGNYEGILPDGVYHECDIDTMHASSRGAKRIVYSTDGRIYYTEDHYESFTLLYGEE